MFTRKNRKMRGGFSESPEIWSKSICVTLVDLINYQNDKVDKKNHLSMLEYLADRIDEWPENLYNKITPDEFLRRLKSDFNPPPDLIINYTHYGKNGYRLTEIPDIWHLLQVRRKLALRTHMWGNHPHLMLSPLPLPKRKNKTAKNSSGNK